MLDFREIEKAKGEVWAHEDDEDCLSFQITAVPRPPLGGCRDP
jgi:hypothetical protein